MTAISERATFDAAAFTRWCDTHLYTPAIRQGTRIVERACDRGAGRGAGRGGAGRLGHDGWAQVGLPTASLPVASCRFPQAPGAA